MTPFSSLGTLQEKANPYDSGVVENAKFRKFLLAMF